MPKLYELSDELRTIQMLLEQGIDDAELHARLERVEGDIESRLLGLAAIVREQELDAAAAKEEATRLAERADSFAKGADRLRAWMFEFMRVTGIDKPIKGTRFTLALRKAPASVRVLDERAIPDRYWRVVPESKAVDKQAILAKYRASGEIIEGVDIVDDRQTLQIR